MKLTGPRLSNLFIAKVVVLCALALQLAATSWAQEPIVELGTRPAATPKLVADFSYDVNLVLVPVTVTDAMNRPVLGLPKNAFTLFEDSKPEDIHYFFSEDAPVSVALVLDFSASMIDKVDSLRQAIRSFFDYANPADEYYVVTVSTYPKVIARGTNSVHEIEQRLADESPAGKTALLDGVDVACKMLKSARYKRRVVVMISDGGDNDSHRSLKDVRDMVQEQNADVYGIGIFDNDQLLVFKPLEDKLGKRTMTRLTDATGGRTISVENVAKVPQAVADLSYEIRNQYVLGYRPKQLKHDSRWRKIKVVVRSAERAVRLQANYKKSYFVGPPQ